MNAGGGKRDAGGGRASRPRYGRVVLAFLILAVLAATVWFSVRAFSNPTEPAVPDDARIQIRLDARLASRYGADYPSSARAG